MVDRGQELHIRRRLVEALKADLVGPFSSPEQPGGGDEILTLPPSRWYLTGFLAPQSARAPTVDDTDSQEGGLDNGAAPNVEDAGDLADDPKRGPRFPASLGLSVFLPPEADHLEAEVSFADYDLVEIADDHEKKTAKAWKRVPHHERGIRVPLDRAVLEGRDGMAVPNTSGLRLRGELRTTDMDGLPKGARVLSLFLVNERQPLDKDRDLAFVFQVQLTLRCAEGFLSRPNRRGEDADDNDQKVLALNFRDHVEWAVGHNTSIVRPTLEADDKVRCLTTTQLPEYEVPRVEHAEIADVTTDMAVLASLDGPGLAHALSPLVDAYGAWIEKQRDIALPRAGLEDTRKALLIKANRARERMRAGIALLESHADVREAWRLANQAMDVAARQADKARPDRRYKDAGPKWRPFQLAFLLMNLGGVADPKHPERDQAELIYFPTGGGKTEAYLGLIAFTLLLRRLRGKARPDEGRGVAVILRYTLRLLTLDQLGRAATLMCALEELRRRDPKRLGNSRFTVGLWVGASATANRLKDVHRALNDYTPGRQESPFPLTHCPWCATEIRTQNIKLVDDAGKPSKTKYTRAVVYCHEASCSFAEAKRAGQGLPVLFVDEQIYQEVPDFIVATVDKYAMVPWLGEAGMLFGRATHLNERRAFGVMHAPPKGAVPLPEGLLPPELIVQDELHLISGPLGTMVGLYEAAVDFLCERRVDGVRVRPKVICSTATVRRAREQIRALFDREMELFPPRGVNDGDNFFAKLLTDEWGRLYVGVAAPGRALRAISVRTYATLLAAAQKHFDPKGPAKQAADPYMSLVGYFNSLRELGGMRRLVEDEVRNRVHGFEQEKRPRGFIAPHPWASSRTLKMPAELTSREPTERVKDTKARLSAPRTSTDPEPVDVVLASNMISVGLDIDRLGLMVVTGQPKTTSEYIQATSRVGRAYPGLVVTCLNVFRPRDRSHYERFVGYHESFYRDVEATTVTPFSGQTLDRGLVGTLLTMLRHGVAELQAPNGVMNIHAQRKRAEQLLSWLAERARHHREWYDDDAEARIADLVQRRGKDFLDSWERIIDKAKQGAAERTYSGLDKARDDGKPLMFTATDEPPDDHDARQFQAPTSMRDVEPTVPIWLRFAPLDERNR